MAKIIPTIRSRMAERRITQTDMAARLGVCQSQVSEWLAGQVSPGVGVVDVWLQLLELELVPVEFVRRATDQPHAVSVPAQVD